MSKTSSFSVMSRTSSFSATCNRLSQYIKQNGGVLTTIAPVITLDLFPQRVGFDDGKAAEKEDEKLTIFYDGKVMVFDGFSADEAREIMDMAHLAAATSCSAVSAVDGALAGGLPMARRRSLHQFIEKRKERVNSKAPYA